MKLGLFETIQLLEGARGFQSLTKNEKDLLFKIMDTLMQHRQELDLDKDEVYPAYDFLCERISHCTRERDMNDSKFNPKTYKNLLLIRDAIRDGHPYELDLNY